MKLQIYCDTNIGKIREENEDSVYISGETVPFVAMVADGMGGHNAGKTASSKAISILSEKKLRAETLEQAICEASGMLYHMTQENSELAQMGTTLTILLLEDERWTVGQVGDSRAYCLENHTLKQITKDHSYVQTLVDKGAITPEEARVHPYKNIITRAVGMEQVEADLYSGQAQPGQIFLLCSDGLINHVPDEELKEILCGPETIGEKGNRLMSLALERGGRDNISIILIQEAGESV